MADPISRQLNTIRHLVGKPIRAYHGSPYKFSRFNASKIGTGEGAQSYGHGLYFAGEENVARQYRNMLGGRRDVFIGDDSATGLYETLREGPAFNMPRTPQGDAVRALMAGAYGVDSVDEVLQNARRYASDNTLEMSAAVNAALDELVARGLRLGPQPGHMYEVEIGYPESSLLDWDRPLKSQSEFVGERLTPFRTDRYDLSPARGTDYETGATAVHRIADAFDSDMAEASAALRSAGIPGIKYWDAGSRSAGSGTRNYVMFPGTEDNIRILRKYGLLAPMALPALQGEE